MPDLLSPSLLNYTEGLEQPWLQYLKSVRTFLCFSVLLSWFWFILVTISGKTTHLKSENARDGMHRSDINQGGHSWSKVVTYGSPIVLLLQSHKAKWPADHLIDEPRT